MNKTTPEIEFVLAKNDPVLKEIIHQIPKPKIVSSKHVFHDLMSCVIEQQIHYRSTKKIFQKMLDQANIEILEPENFEQFETNALANANLSIGKLETITRVWTHFSESSQNWNLLSDDEIIAELSLIKGIGKWTIDMILLYTLQRPNIFPSDDFHLKQIMVALYQLDEKVKLKAQMTSVSEKWGNDKSLAVLYLLDWKKFKNKLT
jgi:DNA-3-methyladenine glycosylase II